MSPSVNEEVKEHYEKFPYPSYPLLVFPNPDSIEDLKNSFSQILDCNSDLKILVGGCGTFEPILVASTFKNAFITAVDFSEKSLKKLNQRLKIYPDSYKNSIQIIQHNLEEPLSQENENYDLVFFFLFLHHSEFPEKILNHTFKVMKNEAILRVLLYSDQERKPVWKAKEILKNTALHRFKNTPVLNYFIPLLTRSLFYFHPELKKYRKNYLDYISGNNKTELWDGFYHPYDPPKSFDFWINLFEKEGFRFICRQKSQNSNLTLIFKKSAFLLRQPLPQKD